MTETKVKPRSKVTRLSPFFNDSTSGDTNRVDNTVYSKIRFGKLKFNPTNRPIFGSTGSHCLVAFGDGTQYYSKSGCCQGITGLNSGNLYYYIPNVAPMSTGKKLKYIDELSKIFNRPIEFVGIENSRTGFSLSHPKQTTKQKEFAPRMPSIPVLGQQNSGSSGFVPYIWVDVSEWLVVKVHTKNNRENLLFLQLLRPLYQYPSVNITQDGMSKTIHYSQPTVYFRLITLFPKLTKLQALWLSHVMHGYSINSTFFSMYCWYYGLNYNSSNITTNLASIVSHFWTTNACAIAAVPRIMGTTTPVNVTPNLNIRSRDIEWVGIYQVSYGPHYLGASSSYLMAKFVEYTYSSLKDSIEFIARSLGDKKLLETVVEPPTKSKIKRLFV